jgi:amino acid permease
MTTSTTADILIPAYDSPERKSSMVVATFNLSATIIGGGVLSLPYAFSKTGILLGCVLMVVSGVMTERSLYLLCLCSRLTGATSYGEVGEAAFGKYMEYGISFILGIFLIFVIIAYMVLVQDIWTSIVQIVGRMGDTKPNPEIVLLVIILLISPFLVQTSLHSLRYNCYIGFASVSILCLALVHHAWTSTPTDASLSILWWSDDFKDVLIAFPIITLSFLSIFNVLPIQNALVNPSRQRTVFVIDVAMFSCFTLTLIFGLAGYMYAGNITDGNILNNCDSSVDNFLLLGEVGCGITLMLAMPMMLLPCRSSLLEVLDVLVNGPHHVAIDDMVGGYQNGENRSLMSVDPDHNQKIGNYETILRVEKSSVVHTTAHIIDSKFVHYTSTILIVVTCYVAAVKIPSVATVWSIIGCFMGYLIAFILPCICYLKILRRYPHQARESIAWVWFSYALLAFSLLASVACTTLTIVRLQMES